MAKAEVKKPSEQEQQEQAMLQGGEYAWKIRSAENATRMLCANSGLHPQVMALVLDKVKNELDVTSHNLQERYLQHSRELERKQEQPDQDKPIPEEPKPRRQVPVKPKPDGNQQANAEDGQNKDKGEDSSGKSND